MLDDFREWLSDNLRYILLGLAVILILVIAFFAIRLVRGLGSPKRNEPETQAQTESMTEAGGHREQAGRGGRRFRASAADDAVLYGSGGEGLQHALCDLHELYGGG